MPEYCYICHTMLSPEMEKCPNCGAPVNRSADRGFEQEYSTREILWYSIVMIGIVLIPILLIIAIGFICTALFL